MENHKKSNFSRSGSKACQTSDSNKKIDLQSNKPWSRNTNTKREQNSSYRNEQQRNKLPSAPKHRNSGDRRSRTSGIYGNDSVDGRAGFGNRSRWNNAGLNENGLNEYSNLIDDYDVASAGLANRNKQNSAHPNGSKKQNLNHLLNFHYASREDDANFGFNLFGRTSGKFAGCTNRTSGGPILKKAKYSKEQYMQANFQFIIKNELKGLKLESPDNLVNWDLIEQVNLNAIEEPKCPICLYPPVAAKMTRCGHVFCWPCILHYLGLHNRPQRRCPLCYESVDASDLKSTQIMHQRAFNVGDEITFQLMRRKKGSMIIEKFSIYQSEDDHIPSFSSNDQMKLFSKFILADNNDVVNILNREEAELLDALDGTESDVFIEEALELLRERRINVNSQVKGNKSFVEENKLRENYGEEKIINSTTVPRAENLKQNDGVCNDNVKKESNNDTKLNDPSGNVDEVAPSELVNADEAPTTNVAPDTLREEDEDDVDIGKATLIAMVDDAAAIAEFVKPSVHDVVHTLKYYYFYQSEDGQNIFLHPLNIKMLQVHYGSLDYAPLLINARIVQMETYSMDEEHRRKFTCLSHLPMTCQFAVYEVELRPPVVSPSVLNLFKSDITLRKKKREQRRRDEVRREKKINEINDRRMGKLIQSTLDLKLDSSAEFPTCGFEEMLTAPTDIDDNTPSTSKAIAGNKQNKSITSYSEVAVRTNTESPQFEFPSLGNVGTNSKPIKMTQQTGAAKDRNADHDSVVDGDCISLSLKQTSLGDVLAEAISQKKHNSISSGNGGGNDIVGHPTGLGNAKKNKKNKKMVPLFSTGINYNGN